MNLQTGNSSDYWKQLAISATGAASVSRGESIQTLWSGYGEIFRAELAGASINSLVVKHVAPPQGPQNANSHPRGWHSDFATDRKLRSYEIEANWYRHWSHLCGEHCRVPACFDTAQIDTQSWILLEDLDIAGYAIRHHSLSAAQAVSCIDWLAGFHATFMNINADNLWPVGTYWHLDTRPDELRAMEPGPLRDAAALIDATLNNCKYKTLVHGDAKVANFCFANDGRVAAVDFQYVGAGCGMKDLAYFIGSCLDEKNCEKYAPQLTDRYFNTLKAALDAKVPDTASDPVDYPELEAEWRDLYAVAWTDFHRFLSGWMPTHKKIHRYTEKLTRDTLKKIKAL